MSLDANILAASRAIMAPSEPHGPTRSSLASAVKACRAIEERLPVLTRNRKHFTRLPGVEVEAY